MTKRILVWALVLVLAADPVPVHALRAPSGSPVVEAGLEKTLKAGTEEPTEQEIAGIIKFLERQVVQKDYAEKLLSDLDKIAEWPSGPSTLPDVLLRQAEPLVRALEQVVSTQGYYQEVIGVDYTPDGHEYEIPYRQDVTKDVHRKVQDALTALVPFEAFHPAMLQHGVVTLSARNLSNGDGNIELLRAAQGTLTALAPFEAFREEINAQIPGIVANLENPVVMDPTISWAAGLTRKDDIRLSARETLIALAPFEAFREAINAQIPRIAANLESPEDVIRLSVREALVALAPFEAFREPINAQIPRIAANLESPDWDIPWTAQVTLAALAPFEAFHQQMFNHRVVERSIVSLAGYDDSLRRVAQATLSALAPFEAFREAVEKARKLMEAISWLPPVGGKIPLVIDGTEPGYLVPSLTAERQVEEVLRLRRQGQLGSAYVHQITVQGRLPDEFKYAALALILASPYQNDWTQPFFGAPWGTVAPMVHDGGNVATDLNRLWKDVKGRTDFLQRVAKVYLKDLEVLEGLPEVDQIKRVKDLKSAELEAYERVRLMLETRAYQRLALALHAKTGTAPQEIPRDMQEKLKQRWADFESKMRSLLGDFGLNGAAEVTWFTQYERSLAGWPELRREAEWEPIQKELIHLEEIRRENPQPLFNRANQILQEAADAIDRDLGLLSAGAEEQFLGELAQKMRDNDLLSVSGLSAWAASHSKTPPELFAAMRKAGPAIPQTGGGWRSFFRVLTPQGEETDFLKVFWKIKQDGDWHGGSAVLFLTPDGSWVLQRQGKGGLLYLSAAGHREVGATPEETAVTETREETSLELDPARLHPVKNPIPESGGLWRFVSKRDYADPVGYDEQGIYRLKAWGPFVHSSHITHFYFYRLTPDEWSQFPEQFEQARRENRIEEADGFVTMSPQELLKQVSENPDHFSPDFQRFFVAPVGDYLFREAEKVLAGSEEPVFDQEGARRMGLEAHLLREQGTRPTQQDDYALVSFGRPDEEPAGVLAIVADGMGGLREGEKASRAAVTRIPELLNQPPASGQTPFADLLMNFRQAEGGGPRDSLREQIQGRLREALVQTSREIKKGGTTAVLALVVGETAFLAWAGDSRIYGMSGGNLELLTGDHTGAWFYEKLDLASHDLPADQVNLTVSKRIREKGLLNSPMLSFLGAEVGEEPFIEQKIVQMKPGDRLALLSDGIFKPADDRAIGLSLQRAPTASIAAAALMKRAQAGHDNRTVIVLEARMLAREPERITRLIAELKLKEVPEERMAVVSFEAAQGYPQLLPLAGRLIRMGNTWLLVLPEKTGELGEILAPLLELKKPLKVWEYGDPSDRRFEIFEWHAKPMNLEIVTRETAQGMGFQDLLSRILANLRNPQATSPEDVRRMEELLSLFV